MRMKGVAGSEGHLLELAHGLAALGWQVDAVVCGPRPEALRPYAAELALAGRGRVTALRMPHDVSIPLIRHVRARLALEHPNVLHTHLVHGDWHGPLAVLGISDVAVVSSKHNPDPFRTGRLYKTGERLAGRRADATIAISKSLAQFIADHGAIEPVVVHYGLPAPTVPPQRESRPLRRIVAVGRLEKQKGHDVLIAAFASLARSDPVLMLQIIGDGSRRRHLEALAARLGIANRVMFKGWCDDVAAILHEADVLVHPARWEGFGLVLLEGMRAALPIVATRVGAIPEIVVDGVTGLLVDADDPVMLAAAIHRLAQDDQTRVQLGLAGFHRVRGAFAPSAMAKATAEVYESACASRRSRIQRRRQSNLGWSDTEGYSSSKESAA